MVQAGTGKDGRPQDALEFEFSVGHWRVRYVVPPVRGPVIKVYAYWRPRMPKNLDLPAHLMPEYMRNRDAIMSKVVAAMGRAGERMRYEVTHDPD